MENIKPYKRRIGFLREKEIVEEEKKARVANHVKLANEFGDEMANFLYIQSPETAIIIIENIRKYLTGLLGENDNS